MSTLTESEAEMQEKEEDRTQLNDGNPKDEPAGDRPQELRSNREWCVKQKWLKQLTTGPTLVE